MKSSVRIGFLISIILFAGLISPAQNLMILNGDSTIVNDTAFITLEIENSEPFTAFQFDLALPADFSFIESSAQLTQRKADHVLVASMVSEDTLRFFAFSMTNAGFVGNDGDVMSFAILTGSYAGNFPLFMDDCLIANPAGQNIISGIVNDTVFVFDPMYATNDEENNELIIFPNPGSGVFNVALPKSNHENWVLKILDLSGQTLFIKYIPAGVPQQEVSFPNPKGIYLLVCESFDLKIIYQKKIVIK